MLSLTTSLTALSSGRPVVTTPRAACTMRADSSRRDALVTGSAMLAAATTAVSSASAKSGEFGKIGIFGMSDISSPYQPGGPQSGPDATFGFKKSDGEFLAKGYQKDVSREKKSFLESSSRISSLQPKIDSKTWWFLRDELRIQARAPPAKLECGCPAYTMRSSMLAMNGVLEGEKKARAPSPTARPAANREAATKAYKKYWSEIEAFDLACKKKEPALANKAREFADVLAALKTYTDIAA
ncbi:hypothetical protein EMIHUDRAFT_437557 [Emiliania huxleyi CCMP1516]|uniref:Uncharacterized protein n=2 Tax=Emiliania huxleyi TaxID=2903 RepID=A0A0D3IJX9_EMIH1|nr:hypothetical protein EMIHUDRAFT_437557 [Emiliania huxleyi CCMP1516]EOD11564.1 hypothetical protein EMIHUDRAFT_437557 [Emiliania huxleyi CCMP1516]|eukprot:XP_005763993.1 hypothetical protein EMIHUDRAFT_437557 [Emiliania huxleyi CCMP1516]